MFKYFFNVLLIASLVFYAVPAEAMHATQRRIAIAPMPTKDNDMTGAGAGGSYGNPEKADPKLPTGENGSTTQGAATSGPAPTITRTMPDSHVAGAAAPASPHLPLETRLQAAVEIFNNQKIVAADSKSTNIRFPSGKVDKLDAALRNSLINHCPKEIDQIIKLLQANSANIDEMDLPRRLLFVGKPGTGKSKLAQAIAEHCGMDFLFYPSSLIANEFHTSGDQNIERIFEEAAALNKPCIVTIDELQSLIRKYRNTKDYDSSMLITLWSMLDKYKKNKILFIGTFNHLDHELPEQIQDRFSENIMEIPLPNAKQRKDILEFYILKRQRVKFSKEFYINSDRLRPSASTLDRLARETDGFSPRSLESVITRAVRTAFSRDTDNQDITLQDFLDAIRDIKAAPKKVKKQKTWWEWSKIKGLQAASGLFTISPHLLWLGWAIWQNRAQTTRENELLTNQQNREDEIRKTNIDFQKGQLASSDSIQRNDIRTRIDIHNAQMRATMKANPGINLDDCMLTVISAPSSVTQAGSSSEAQPPVKGNGTL